VITPAINEAAGKTATADIPAGYERQRADRLMERAHAMLDHNFREEALRLAAVAEQLEKSKQAVYHAGEERPSDLVAQLQQPAASNGTTGSASAAEIARADSTRKRAYRNHSVKEDPRAVASRTGRIVLTDISAGWQAADSNGSDSSGIEPAAAGKAAPQAGRNQLAHLETTGKADDRGASGVETAPPPTELASADASTPPPEVLSKDGKEASGTGAAASDASPDDSANADPILENETPAATVSRWNTTTIIGLIAGLGGLLGLAFWRRQERKHYSAATR
jgi:hypothetical protein